MKLNFRQGIVRAENAINGTTQFLAFSNGGISIIANNDPFIVSLAHGAQNYLHQEVATVTNAWSAPFQPGKTTYLYIDINTMTGVRAFGKTTVQPITATNAPSNPLFSQHWFDLGTATMRVWNGGAWLETIRVFVGEVINGSSLLNYPIGTTVGIVGVDANTGFILFDDELKPVKVYDNGIVGRFLTTESPLSSQLSRSANYRLETGIVMAEVGETIPKWSPICYTSRNRVGIARNTMPQYPAVGIATENLAPGDNATFMTSGYATENLWNWNNPINSNLYVSSLGELTDAVPQTSSVQRIATIIDRTTILVNVGPVMIYL